MWRTLCVDNVVGALFLKLTIDVLCPKRRVGSELAPFIQVMSIISVIFSNVVLLINGTSSSNIAAGAIVEAT